MILHCRGDGPFERPEYLEASAAHEGSKLAVVAANGARLNLLRGADGELHTVYGYPHPVGRVTEDDLAALAVELGRTDAPLRIALSPMGCGAALARHLVGRLPVAFERLVCIADLDGDPVDNFAPKARAKVRRALNGGVTVETGPMTPEFGLLYRSAMDDRGADRLYFFGDAYFAAFKGEGAFVVTAHDRHGPCAAAMFLVGGADASYHLSARRVEPEPEAGSVNLVLLEGLRECARRGASACVLGGGTTGDPDDPLLRFKAGMATRTLKRPTFRRV